MRPAPRVIGGNVLHGHRAASGGASGRMTNPSFGALATDHTLPTYFAGIGLANLNSGDFSNATYRAMMANLAPEILRLNPWHDTGTPASPQHGFNAMRDLCVYLQGQVGIGVWMGPTSAHPNGQPSTTSEVSTTNYASTGGYSPTAAGNWLTDFVTTHGVNVLGVEFYNEPDNCANGTGGSGPGDGPWFGAGGANPAQSDINKCETWAASIHRQYRAAIVATGLTMPKIGGHVVSSAQGYAQRWARKFANGHVESTVSGATWPYADSNFDGYYDVHTFHPYQSHNPNQQGQLNTIWFTPAATGDWTNLDVYYLATKSFLTNMRSYFDSNGKSTKLAYDEYGDGAGTAFSGLVEVAQAILGFGWMGEYGIDFFSTWSGCRSASAVDFPVCADTTYTLNTRACAMRDLVFYFSRNYKSIIAYGQAGGNTPSSGDLGGNNNSVPRLPWVAARNAANNKLAVLVANIDLTNSDTLTVTWSGSAASGSVVGRQLLQTTTTTGTTSLPTVTFTPSSNSFTRTIEAGAAYLFEVPI